MGEAKKRREAGLMPYQQASPVGWPAKADMAAALRAFIHYSQPAPTTPTLPLSEKVKSLCARISSFEPQMLTHTSMPEQYKAGFCHVNVLHQVKQHGGGQVCGWMIWEGTKFVEAEFHSVWEPAPDAPLVDVTPRVDGEIEVLFLRDASTRLTTHAGVEYGVANRTDIPGCPYTAARQPYPAPIYPVDYSLDPALVAEMRRLGFKTLSQAIGLNAFD